MSPKDGANESDRRAITDARAMRALAHPVRVALFELVGREGSLTATKAAELLDESPGNMSWHLQTLAKYGFVEEAEGGTGRSRPWRVVTTSHSLKLAPKDSESAAAAVDALETNFLERSYQRLHEWWAARRSYPAAWRKAAFSIDVVSYLTVEEMKELSEAIDALFRRYPGRVRDRSSRPADSLPIHFVAFGHPIPTTPDGN
jgi:DNA-binding transcriptional ArsR family regulator